MLAHDGLQRPPQTAARQLGPRLGGEAGVLTPHMPTAGAPVAAHRHLQCGGAPPQRSCASRRITVSRGAPSQPRRRHQLSGSTPDTPTPPRPGSRRCPTTSKLIEPAEHSQVRADKGSVRHEEPDYTGFLSHVAAGRLSSNQLKPLPMIIAPCQARPQQ